MELWSADTCERFEKDESLPLEFQHRAGDTCLSCKHSIKCSHDGDIDIIPCGNPKPRRTILPTPR